MKLLFDEMYAPTVAEQLRGRGHDVASVHDPGYHTLQGASDEEIWAAAIVADRALASENVRDFRRIETDALARGQPAACLIFTTDRQFPRGDPGTLGRLVLALDALLASPPDLTTALFLKPSTASYPGVLPRGPATEPSQRPRS
jgi:predicted nuclease of predicted toxin-antitoxin system